MFTIIFHFMKDYDGSNFTEVNIQSIQRNYAVGLMAADFLGEGVKLGEPVKTVDRSDLDYTAILQMMPYHVDNITPDGKSLTDNPQNFTLLLNAHIGYNNTSTSSDKSSMTYSMTSTAETIFALDSEITQGAAKTFQGVRGITSTLLGDTPTGKAVEGIGKFWDTLKDTTETTKSTSNTNEATSIMSIATQANYLDTLYLNTSNRYIWRYPVYNPPSWILERTLSSYGTFDKSKAKTQQTYITFAMSEPGIRTAAKGTNDSHYQPYHESGNLFSYPAALEQIEGYEGHTSLLGGGSTAAKRWDGSAIDETITFINTETNQESTKKTNKAGAITKFLSAVDNIFGSSFASVPYDTVSSFTRSVSDKESISVNLPGALSGAQFSAVFEPYLDVTGATVVGFAVESFRDIDALWNQDSLYSKKPDPSFLNRRDSSGKMIDCGGNNMAYFKIGISNTDSVPFDRTKLETQYRRSSFGEKFAAADISSSEFPFVEFVKIDGMDFRDFIEQKVDGQIEPVAGEVEVKYVGEELMTDAVLIGYALKPESSSKDISEITDADIGMIFVKEHFALFPGEDHKLHFRINPKDLENGVGFLLQVYGIEYPLTDIIYGSAGTESDTRIIGSSSGGCESFGGIMAGVLALIFVIKKRKG
ncbi:MAG: hypothetical protein IJQ75_02040 [Synergistaceae bacterium]|nr:hypothetical protein [Synergistaceae bacterium]